MKNNLEKKWEIFPPVPPKIQNQLQEFPPIFRQILHNRGIENSDGAKVFLSAADIQIDPFLLKDLDKAVQKIHDAIKSGKKIVVFGDYDADGVTATALLVLAIKKAKGWVEKYIPNRFIEGYGFSIPALEEVKKLNPDLLITVDCGVRSVEEVACAKSAGMDVIVTDHHQPHNRLPSADAVICPKRQDDLYPFKDLSGVGIAYKLICGLKQILDEDSINPDEWLDLVAIGTIADLAPLTGENRVLVKRGLKLIRENSRPGVKALAVVSSINPALMSGRDIGFMIAPRLNAAGRLETAQSAFDLLVEEEVEKAYILAKTLDGINKERQIITKDIIKEVEKYFDYQEPNWLMFYAHENFNEGVVGLAASRLAENYYRPAVIGTVNGDFIRASCRSINEVNITAALDECSDLLEKHGGHAMAAGLTIRKELVDEFKFRLNEVIASRLMDKPIIPILKAEMEIGLSQLHPSLLTYLKQLEPCGEGNPTPLFISRNLEITSLKRIGTGGEHLKIDVRNDIDDMNKSRITYSGICFNFGWLSEELIKGDSIDLVYSYDENIFNGRAELQLKVEDIKPAKKGIF